MRILLVAMDTRGGVAPYGTLGGALATRGHEVWVAAPSDLVTVLPGTVRAIPLPGEMRAAIEALGSTEGVQRAPRRLREELQVRTAAATRAILERVGGVDAVLAGVGGAAIAEAVAIALDAALLEAHLQPLGPAAAEYPGVLAPRPLQRPGLPRRLGHLATAQLVGLPAAGTRSSARAAAEVDPRATARRVPGAVYGYSEQVVPRPRSWHADRVITGYWRQPEDESTLERDLAAFLDAHSGPLVVGFGSMRVRDPSRIAWMLLEAATAVGMPLVVLNGWNTPFPIDGLPEDVFVAEEAPHHQLFRRAAAVVHHGGAGTTGAVLTAGTPSIVIPFAADQSFWAGRVHAVGAGPSPLRLEGLTTSRLAAAIHEACDDATRRAAEVIGGRLVRENGPALGAGAVERLLC